MAGSESATAPGGRLEPRISVAISSHGRPLRLRWLLGALAAQTLPRDELEVIVVHDCPDSETERVLAGHPLAADGTLRVTALEPRTSIATNRNAGWRQARAPLVAFTDDDCRPDPGWLEALLATAERHPGAIVQGATEPDPDEVAVGEADPFFRPHRVVPPSDWADTCNIAYPRELLERLEGFDEDGLASVGEDSDMAMRARGAGAVLVAAPQALVYHAASRIGLLAQLRDAWRWHRVAYVVRRHPELRRSLTLGVFWRPAHALFLLAICGLVLARRRRGFIVLALPWLRLRLGWYGPGPRGRARAAAELAAWAALDGAEVASCIAGSVRYRSLWL